MEGGTTEFRRLVRRVHAVKVLQECEEVRRCAYGGMGRVQKFVQDIPSHGGE
jgi:hypothetical protein